MAPAQNSWFSSARAGWCGPVAERSVLQGFSKEHGADDDG
jgi:hypothetical protein